MAILVSDVMTREVITAEEGISAYDAAEKMGGKGISCLIILKNKKVSGIVTERDFLKRVILKGIEPKKAKVKDIMSVPVISIDLNAELDDAARLMRDNKIKKLVVTDQNHDLAGVITSFDLVIAEPVIKILLERDI
jgi:CBS domain-containing protein